MLTSNHQKASKDQVIRYLQTSKSPKLDVWDIDSTTDHTKFNKELTKILTTKSVSIIVVKR